MTAGELIKALRGYPKDAEVYIVDNWDAVDEDLNELATIMALQTKCIFPNDYIVGTALVCFNDRIR